MMSRLTDRIVVIGASGQLGSDLMRVFADLPAAGVDHASVDIEQPSAIAGMLSDFEPTLVVNTAAYHNVERCELHPERAFAVNTVAAENLAAQCRDAGSTLLHVSTDYVFNGRTTSPYTEDAAPDPLNLYGISKFAGELALRHRLERNFIVRTSGLYGVRGSSTKGHTFIERMLSQAAEGRAIRVVNDTTCSPSYTLHVARAIRAIAESEAFGTYHVTNSGHCSWYEFASEIFAQARITPELLSVNSDAFPSPVRRPRFSALRGAALARIGLPPLPDWRDGIADYLAERVTR